MYAITGAFGQTGGALSQALLDAGQSIRMIVRRDDDEADRWRRKGAEVVVDLEMQLPDYEGKTTALRAANFMENWAWSMQPISERDVLPSMFTPLDRRLPMVSAVDIGRTAASLLMHPRAAGRVVELHGPDDCSPSDAAQAFSRVLGRRIEAVADNPAQFASVMAGRGFPLTTVNGLIEMFDGFNSGLIAFEGTHDTWRGQVHLQDAVAAMLGRA